MPNLSTAGILDLTEVAVRNDRFVFELLDSAHNLIGQLKVSDTSAPHVRNDTSRSVFRTCTGLTVLDGARFPDANYVPLSQINTLRDRVRVSMVLQNGVTFPLGVFMIGDDNRAPFSWGQIWTPELFDETFIVDQPLDQTYGLAPGDSILQLVNLLVGQVGLASVDFSGITDAHASSTVSYAAGSSRNQAVIALVALLGCFAPYFDNSGVYTTKAAPSPSAGPDLIYGSDDRVLDGTTTTTNSIYRAANRYEVVTTGAQGGPVGIYDLPASAPNSYANTGLRVVSSSSSQGIPDVATANLAAYINALTDRDTYVVANFSSTADPRHDTFSLVQIFGVLMQETAWEITCSSGGAMTHTLSAYYPSTP